MHCTLHANQHFFSPPRMLLVYLISKISESTQQHHFMQTIAPWPLGSYGCDSGGQKLYNNAAVVRRQYTLNLDERGYFLAATLLCKVMSSRIVQTCGWKCLWYQSIFTRHTLSNYTVFCSVLFQLLLVPFRNLWLHFHNPWLQGIVRLRINFCVSDARFLFVAFPV